VESLTTWTPDESEREETCPLLDNPEPDCYFLNLSSLSIPKAVSYCLGDFRQCPIYKITSDSQNFERSDASSSVIF
jgi:hypothetical protein